MWVLSRVQHAWICGFERPVEFKCDWRIRRRRLRAIQVTSREKVVASTRVRVWRRAERKKLESHGLGCSGMDGCQWCPMPGKGWVSEEFYVRQVDLLIDLGKCFKLLASENTKHDQAGGSCKECFSSWSCVCVYMCTHTYKCVHTFVNAHLANAHTPATTSLHFPFAGGFLEFISYLNAKSMNIQLFSHHNKNYLF